jgi:hypothetical protein
VSAIGFSGPPPVDPARPVERLRRPGREDGAEQEQHGRRENEDAHDDERTEDDDGRVHIDLHA